MNNNMSAGGGSAFGGDFKKDLLLVDLETTGLDAQKQEIIQIAAVLLDRKTLKEKKSFNSFIKPTKWKSRDLESMKVNKIPYDTVKFAPSLETALEKFQHQFKPNQVILAYYGGPVDTDFLRAAYKKFGKKFPFDYHYFNIWALFYSYFAIKNKLSNPKKFTGFSLDDFMEHFKISAEGGSEIVMPDSKSGSARLKSGKLMSSGGKYFGPRHDALTDCRIEAEIFRKVVKDLAKNK